MTLADLRSTVDHALQKAAEANVPPHKVLVTVVPASSQRQELFPGALKKLDEEQLASLGCTYGSSLVLELESE